MDYPHHQETVKDILFNVNSANLLLFCKKYIDTGHVKTFFFWIIDSQGIISSNIDMYW